MAGGRIVVEQSPANKTLLRARFDGDTAGFKNIALDIYCDGSPNLRETLYIVDNGSDGFISSAFRPCAAKMEIRPRPAFEVVMGETKTEAPKKVYPGVIVNVPGGEFEMGTVCDGRHGIGGTHDPDEHTSDGKTVHIKISAFRMAKTEVTIGEYVHYLMESRGIGKIEARKLLPKDDFGNNKKGDDFPIVALTYTEMMEFAKYYGGTLPTAAQYEYASKGPSHNDLYGTPIDKAIILNNSATTIAIAEVAGPNDERCNGFGLCDLAGNVWERTLDEYDSKSYDSLSKTDPSKPFKAGLVEYRGGSFNYDQRSARAADRSGVRISAGRRNNVVGLRVAWSQDSST